MVKICEMRVQSYPHSDYRFMKCLVTFDNSNIDGFYFFGTRLDWLNKIVQLEDTYPDTIFKTKFTEA